MDTLFLFALVSTIVAKIRQIKGTREGEAVSSGGFLVILVFLSLSKYQLPHYTFPIHPLAAVITAAYLRKYINTGVSKSFKVAYGLQLFVMFVMFVLSFLLVDFVFHSPAVFTVFIGVSLVIFLLLLFSKNIASDKRIVLITVIPFIVLSIVLNTSFYPNLLSFQADSTVTKDVNKIASNGSKLLIYNDGGQNCMMFYSHMPVREYITCSNLKDSLVKGHTFIFAREDSIGTIQKLVPEIKVIKHYENFGVTGLNIQFLNPSERSAHVERKALLQY